MASFLDNVASWALHHHDAKAGDTVQACVVLDFWLLCEYVTVQAGQADALDRKPTASWSIGAELHWHGDIAHCFRQVCDQLM